MRWRICTLAAVLMSSGTALAAAGDGGGTSSCTPGPWTLVSTDTSPLPLGLTRSQGVTSDGNGWIVSWQAGVSRTNDAYTVLAATTLPPDFAVNHPSYDPGGSGNHVGANHIGDIDVHDGLVYAPAEDGGFNVGVTNLNTPGYQHSYIALYDAKTLAYTGRRYELPLALKEAGVPWVAVDLRSGEVYTDEWQMTHDRINVYDSQLRFQRFIPLHYPASFGAGFHLSRIQGAKVLRHTMYASRDDDAKSIYSIDPRTGDVTRLFSLNPVGNNPEVESLAIRPTSDGALLHVLLILDGRLDSSLGITKARVLFEHFAPPVHGCAG
jgi:hypothetical protein